MKLETFGGLAIGTLMLAGCGDLPHGTADTSGSEPATVEQSEALGVGAKGEVIRNAYEYLKRFGYFPNAELAEQYPGFRPIVPSPPAEDDVFDTALEVAVQKFQANAGLSATGLLDKETLARMAQPRCGVPDKDPASPGQTAKYALSGTSHRWTKRNIKFGFKPGQVPPTNVQNIVRSSVAVWQQNSYLTFAEVSASPDFWVSWKFIDGPKNLAGTGGAPPFPALDLDSSETLSDTEWAGVIIHELGHVLGIDHSSLGSSLTHPIMWPFVQARTTLDDDDRFAINVMYDDFVPLTGTAVDIGVGNTNRAWIVRTNGVPARASGSSFADVPGVVASRVDVDRDGEAYVVATDNRIYKHSSSGWAEVPGNGRALDVGVGYDGSIFVLGTDRRAWRFNSSSQSWVSQGSPNNVDLIAIDVEADGVPIVVTAGNEVWRNLNGWRLESSGRLTDVGAGGTAVDTLNPHFFTWGIGTDTHVWARDLQPASVDGTVSAPAADTWWSTDGIAKRVSVGTRGRVWVVATDGSIWVRSHGAL